MEEQVKRLQLIEKLQLSKEDFLIAVLKDNHSVYKFEFVKEFDEFSSKEHCIKCLPRRVRCSYEEWVDSVIRSHKMLRDVDSEWLSDSSDFGDDNE